MNTNSRSIVKLLEKFLSDLSREREHFTINTVATFETVSWSFTVRLDTRLSMELISIHLTMIGLVIHE